MAKHSRGDRSFCGNALKLLLLFLITAALLFVVCCLYPDIFSSKIVKIVDRTDVEARMFFSGVSSYIRGLKEPPKVVVHGGGQPEALSPDVVEPAAPPAAESADKRPIMSIVVDDGGNTLNLSKRVAELDMPLTWAIMPYTKFLKQTVELAENAGVPYLLHLPMQAEIDKDGSKEYIIGRNMSRASIRNATAQALNTMPGAIGLNNHRGSLATADWNVIVPVIDELKARGLMFLDSRTSGKSVAYDAAKAAGIQAVRNNGFLDGTPDKAAIQARFNEAVKQALKNGRVVVICHFRPATVLFLESLDKTYSGLPVRLVTLQEMAEAVSKSEKDKEE